MPRLLGDNKTEETERLEPFGVSVIKLPYETADAGDSSNGKRN
jgi:hypothetical protein